ncbi:aBC transporter related protein [Clostridium sp. CAG:568]|nr:aBC transporter related protein [Clostridium sp. CAG:568]
MNQKKKRNVLLSLIKEMARLHPWLFALSIICIIISAIASVTAPVAIQRVIDGLENIHSTGDVAVSEDVFKSFAEGTLYPCLIFMAISYTLGNLAMGTYAVALAYIGQDFMHKTRCKIFSHMEDLPVRYFDQHQKGEIMSIYTNDVDTIRQFTIQTTQTLFSSLLTFITIFVMMLMFSVYLTIIFIVGVIGMFIASSMMGKKAEKYFDDQQKSIGEQEGLIEEMMGGLKVVKSFNHEEKAKNEFDKKNKNLMNSSYQANWIAGAIGPVIINVGYIIYVITIIVGIICFAFNTQNYGFQFGLGTMTLGITLGFDPLVQQAIGLVNTIGQQFGFIAQAKAGASRVYKMLDEKVEADDGYVELVQGHWDGNNFVEEEHASIHSDWAWKHPHKADNSTTYVPVKGDIKMFDVDFSYIPGKIILHDIDLYAKPGQKIAFVGSTGAGKTTITNLLNRFYDIEDGKIRFDDININKIKKKDLRRSLGVVLQDTSLFSGTIMDNIRYGRLDATDEECIEAAKLANADGFIRMLPNGYNTFIEGDGSSLSQGQCQLLSIARVAVSDPPVLILDEATSSIDTMTEAIVTKGMDKLMEGRTVFAIAHRLSTIMNSNVIMVLDHGRIIERGTHNQLLEEKGVYYQLYTGTKELS